MIIQMVKPSLDYVASWPFRQRETFQSGFAPVGVRLSGATFRCKNKETYGMSAQKYAVLAAFGLAMLVFAQSGARADELDDIVKSGTLKVGIFEDFPPFSSAGSDMSLHGYDIDVANVLAKAMKVKLELVGITGQNRIPYL